MRILIGCELSGTTRRAFAERGHVVVSCDLEEAEDGAPSIHVVAAGVHPLRGMHYKGDIFDLLKPCYEWDMVIAHPPCTYLSVSGIHWNTRPEGLAVDRAGKTIAAMEFAERIWACQEFVPRVCIENPVGVLSTRSTLGQPTQYIQPYNYGEDASKKTALWLYGLPELQPTQFVPGRVVKTATGTAMRWANQTDSGQNKLGPVPNRAKIRSKTYDGWAQAMAEQWGSA